MAAYTFLTMCQNVAQDAGLSGNKMSSVVGQTNDLARIVRYVREACIEIESKWTDWKFMWGGITSFPLVAGQAVYFADSSLNLNNWDLQRMRIDDLQVPVESVFQYAEVKLTDMELTAQGMPYSVVVQPDNSLRFIMIPDAPHTFYSDYYVNPTMLMADADEPRVPDRFRPVIQSMALLAYANFDNAAELVAKATEELGTWLPLLEDNQRPGAEMNAKSYGNRVTIITE